MLHAMLRTASFVVISAIALVSAVPSGGCAAPATTDAPSTCKPGEYYFCRCKNRDDGSHLCKADGRSFEACEPCESTSEGEFGGDDPDDPVPAPAPRDAGHDSRPLPTETCGDGVVQDGEECDDANSAADDGCDESCHLSGTNPLSSRSCPGMPVHVGSLPVAYGGTTVGSTNTAAARPACPGTAGVTSGSTTADRVFRVVARRTGTMKVRTSDATFDAFLYVTTSCVPDGRNLSYFACENGASGINAEALSFPVTAGSTYSVVVDGAGVAQQGEFRVTFSIE